MLKGVMVRFGGGEMTRFLSPTYVALNNIKRPPKEKTKKVDYGNNPSFIHIYIYLIDCSFQIKRL